MHIVNIDFKSYKAKGGKMGEVDGQKDWETLQKDKALRKRTRYKKERRKAFSSKPLFNERFMRDEEVHAKIQKDIETYIRVEVRWEIFNRINPKRKMRIIWNEEKAYIAIRTLVDRLIEVGMKKEEIGVREFAAAGLQGLLSHHFDNSPSAAIKYVYPQWEPNHTLRVVPQGYWQNEAHVVEAVRLVVERVRLEGRNVDPSEGKLVDIWLKDFIELGFDRLIKLYDSVYRLLKLLPEYKNLQCWQMKMRSKHCNVKEHIVEISELVLREARRRRRNPLLTFSDLTAQDFFAVPVGVKLIKAYKNGVNKLKKDLTSSLESKSQAKNQPESQEL